MRLLRNSLFFLCLPILAAAAAMAGPVNFKDTAKAIRPSVVNISTVRNVKAGVPFGLFGGDPMLGERTFRTRSLGSGVIIDAAKGYVLTNNHVVEDADQIKVKLADKREMDGEIVGRDPKTDLAVVRIKQASNLKAAPFGDSDLIEVGDWVLAVGSPFGLEQTVSHGIVSAKGRVIGQGPYDDFLQTDAPINPGNSGGPLVDLSGAVVGINSAISSRSGGSEGVGFAIPSNLAKNISRQLIQGGKITRGWLGISIQDLDASLAHYFGMPEGSTGAVVADVMEDGPASKGRLLGGDVVTELDGKKIEGVRDLQRRIADEAVGKAVDLKVWRDKKWKMLSVKVGDMATFEGETPGSRQAGRGGQRLGIELRTLSPEEAHGLQGGGRVLIQGVAPGSPAEDAGLQAGDLILELDRVKVSTAEEFSRKVGAMKGGSAMVLRISREGRTLFLTLKVPESEK